jgi:hypothetical protein
MMLECATTTAHFAILNLNHYSAFNVQENKEVAMQCQFCKQFDSYKSQGGQPHWLDFGFCHQLKKTVKETDKCSVPALAVNQIEKEKYHGSLAYQI